MLRDILESARAGKRISESDALALLEGGGLLDLGEAADAARKRLHPEPVVTYIVDRNINYTNVCITRCAFCAFSRPAGDPEAYTLSREELASKIRELKAAGGIQVLLQGGHHPGLMIDWYEDLLRFMKSFGVHIHGFSSSEITHIAQASKLPIRETLLRLRAAGLDSIPGGGAEILVDRVRTQVSPRKLMTDGWLAVMREAHAIGMKSTATMVFGHVETLADRVEHFRRLRELQDESLSRGNGGGFTAFICWSMQPDNTALARLPKAGAHEYLKTLAVARLYLDNIPNVQASWVTQGDKIASLALTYGANDMGSTMLEENVVRSAGAVFRMPEGEIRRCIQDLGLVPRRRDCFYRIVE